MIKLPNTVEHVAYSSFSSQSHSKLEKQCSLCQAAVLTDCILAERAQAALLSQGPAAHHAQEGGVAAWAQGTRRDPVSGTTHHSPVCLPHCSVTRARLQLNRI